jgi:hypothetical protein
MIPEDNAKDLPEIPDNVKNGLEIIPVAKMSDVLKHALTRMPEAITWDPDAKPGNRDRCGCGRRRRRDHRALTVFGFTSQKLNGREVFPPVFLKIPTGRAGLCRKGTP